MALAIVYARAQLGITAPLVTVEVHLSNGLPGFTIVGLPEAAVKESKDRVRSALLNSHFEFPQRRITVNLAPADLPKEGGRYDLAIALGILAASEQVPAQALARCEFVAELALSGELRPVRGAIGAALAAGGAGRALVVASANGAEAGLADASECRVADNLLQVTAHLHDRAPLAAAVAATPAAPEQVLDLSEVRGQTQARRALEVAAAGGHNLLLYGPPGTGKSMLASRLPSILPPLDRTEAIEVAAIESLSSREFCWRASRPFRAPHHTASAVALVGGGGQPKPGEVSLAHRGVLFLDELPEFSRHVLEVLRQPLETGEIHISRAQAQVSFPAKLQLIAAMNPCPCGYWGSGSGQCQCSAAQVERYRQKISGPLLDRIDLQVQVASLSARELQEAPPGEASARVRERVLAARERQLARQGVANAELRGAALAQHCALAAGPSQMLAAALDRLRISARAYDRILRVARTLADLNGAPAISAAHLSEALAYRALDRRNV